MINSGQVEENEQNHSSLIKASLTYTILPAYLLLSVAGLSLNAAALLWREDIHVDDDILIAGTLPAAFLFLFGLAKSYLAPTEKDEKLKLKDINALMYCLVAGFMVIGLPNVLAVKGPALDNNAPMILISVFASTVSMAVSFFVFIAALALIDEGFQQLKKYSKSSSEERQRLPIGTNTSATTAGEHNAYRGRIGNSIIEMMTLGKRPSPTSWI